MQSTTNDDLLRSLNRLQPLYVPVLTEGEWLGAWGDLPALLEWQRPDGQVAVFTLLTNGLDEDDEYQIWQPGTQVLGYWYQPEGEDGYWRTRPVQ